MVSPARESESPEEWFAYYDLRWRVLRAPWNQPRGSEKDELEDEAIHRIIVDDNQMVVAAGRIHFTSSQTAQIRYMVVAQDYERQGLATTILNSLEQAALMNNCSNIILHAREDALGFYQKRGYTTIEPSHTLYNKIKHYLMRKQQQS